MKNCPICGGPLRAAFEEHTDYPVTEISEGMVDIEEHNGDTYDTELIHIACDACNKYWYSISDFLREAGEEQKPYDPVGGGGGAGRSDLPAGSRGEED